MRFEWSLRVCKLHTIGMVLCLTFRLTCFSIENVQKRKDIIEKTKKRHGNVFLSMLKMAFSDLQKNRWFLTSSVVYFKTDINYISVYYYIRKEFTKRLYDDNARFAL